MRSSGGSALDKSGLTACVSTWCRTSAPTLHPTGPFINTVGIVNCLSGVYDVPATYARIRLAVTNTAPMAAYRGAGRPIMSYAIERLVDHAARGSAMDPAEFRRRNFIPKEKFPYKIAAGFEYDCGDFGGVMDTALNASSWTSFQQRKEEAKRRGSRAGAAWPRT